MKNYLRLISIAILIVGVLSCGKKEDNTNNSGTGKSSVMFTFHHLAGEDSLVLGSSVMNVDTNTRFTCNQLAYYISNIKLVTSSGDTVRDAYGYHLVRQGSKGHSQSFLVNNVPTGDYQSIILSLGVDPVRNFSIDNVGDLDISNYMAWGWNTGYKFVLCEGEAIRPDASRTAVFLHLGHNEGYRTVKVTPTAPSTVLVKVLSNKKAKVDFDLDLSQISNGTNLSRVYDVMSISPENRKLMNNFAFQCLKFKSASSE